MKKVLLAACAGLCVMFMTTSSGSGKSNKNNRISQVISQNDWKYYGDSTKPDSPKLAMNVILSDTTKDSTKLPKFVAMISDTTKDSTRVPKLVAMISDTTKDTISGPKYAIIEKIVADTTKDTTSLPKYDMAYNGR